MSPETMQSSLERRVKTLRCGQPLQSWGGLALGRWSLGRGVLGQQSPDAAHAQLAETIEIGFAFDREALGADGFGEVRIAFLYDHAAVHAFDEISNQTHRQGVGHSQFQDARAGGRLVRVHGRDPRGDDAEFSAIADASIEPGVLVPGFDLR